MLQFIVTLSSTDLPVLNSDWTRQFMLIIYKLLIMPDTVRYTLLPLDVVPYSFLTWFSVWSCLMMPHRCIFNYIHKTKVLYVKVVHHYSPQRSCEGYVFTGVCLSTGGCVHVPGGVSFGGCMVWGCMVLGVWSQGGCMVPGGGWLSGSRGVSGRPPGRDGYCCGRYASYWNAFLFCTISIPTQIMDFLKLSEVLSKGWVVWNSIKENPRK